ncbi:MAG: cupin domain-containing protein [Myxococcaceae bacterium]|nr:cupin domain-containing protein [Myxococcaceae bacterium]
MRKIEVRHFRSPDERRPFVEHGEAKVYRFGDRTIGLGTFEPGWRWSKDVGPIAGTKSCQAAHTGFVTSGRMMIRMDSGEEVEVSAGDFVIIPPGHDAWVLGDDTCVVIDWSGMEHYAEAQPGTGMQPEAGTWH